MKSIYETELANIGAPQAAWLYDVHFVFENNDIIMQQTFDDIVVTPISISLPQMAITTFDAHFCGTKQSYPICSDQSGEINCEFLLTPDIFRTFVRLRSNDTTYPEFDRSNRLSHIEIFMYDSALYAKYRYRIYNPIITAIEHGDSLSYESDSQINVSMTIHYNNWDVSAR